MQENDERDIEFLKNACSNKQVEEIFLKMRNTIHIRENSEFSLNDFPRFLDTPGLVSGCMIFAILFLNNVSE